MAEALAPAGPRAPLAYPEVPVDGLLRAAAARRPGRVAIRRTDGAGVTFAELDAQVDLVAAALHRLLGEGAVCGVATVLDPAFARAFYAVGRSGNAVVSINPLHPPAASARALAASGARAAILPAALRERLAGELAALPGLTVLDLDTLLDWAAGSEAEGATGPLPTVDPDALACIHFTSGTTGRPKGVRLSHRNLVVNAMQTVQAHGLDEGSVVLNHLPAYHLMHLDAGVCAGATQLLHHGGDPAEAVARCAELGATHYYSLPVRLAGLAAHPRLPELPAGALRGIFSGGSALAPAAGDVLRAHFGIPVIQGFGLAETSSMTHLDDPARPKPGSVGPPAADTECRIVDVDGRAPLPPGRAGEIQVRGPQLMLGYLDGSPGADADGWLSTGDVGYVDGEGYLFLVDRLKDVFKCDNEMVAPSELERVLGAHPDVADCAVVDRPDPVHGAVPYAFVVLSPGPEGPGSPESPEGSDRLGPVVGQTNDKLEPYQWIRQATAVAAIPRSPIGKIDRRALRARAADTEEVTTCSR
jgi:long-chain acyl-CoA synthetase